jgi:deazaflavin-dependent oxidoreductase (nitroreductase family)
VLDTPNYTPEQLSSLRRFFHAMNHVMVFMLRLGLGRMCEWWPQGFGRIMMIEHRGRRSGKRYLTPVNYARVDDDVYCLAGFGPRTDWYRNIMSEPRVRLWLPRGQRAARASDATDSPQRVCLMRQVIIGSGFAGPLMGVDQRKLSDEQLDQLTRDYLLVHFELEDGHAVPGR